MKHNWHLDNNGISLSTDQNKEVLDLHNECEISAIEIKPQSLIVNFKKNIDYVQNSEIPLESIITLIISGVKSVNFPTMKYPCEFEGIYDISADKLSLCIEDECYPITGKDIGLSFESDLSKA